MFTPKITNIFKNQTGTDTRVTRAPKGDTQWPLERKISQDKERKFYRGDAFLSPREKRNYQHKTEAP